MTWWVLAVTSGLVKLKEDRLNMCHENSGRTARGEQHFVRGKGIEEWKIIHRPQGPVKAFQLSQGWKVRMGNFCTDMAAFAYFFLNCHFIVIDIFIYNDESKTWFSIFICACPI